MFYTYFVLGNNKENEENFTFKIIAHAFKFLNRGTPSASPVFSDRLDKVRLIKFLLDNSFE